LNTNDNDVWYALTRAERDPAHLGHNPARRIVRREHFRLLYKVNAVDLANNPEAALVISNAAKKEFGESRLRSVAWKEENRSPIDFPVRWHDGRILSARGLSEPLRQLPIAEIDALFIDPELQEQAATWLAEKRESLLKSG
jgi:uncharacterized protein